MRLPSEAAESEESKLMWLTVVLMGIVAAMAPMRIAAIVMILSRRQPVRHLLAYLIGGFALSLAVNAVILFALEGVGIGRRSRIPGGIEIAVGVLALALAALVASGKADKLRRKRKHQKAPAQLPTDGGHDTPTAAAEAPQGIHQLAAFQKLPGPVQQGLKSESTLVAWILGGAVARPSALFLAAIAAIVGSGAGVAPSVAALIVLNLTAFILAEAFLIGFLGAPEATRRRVDRLWEWMQVHHRFVVASLPAAVGLYLLIVGIRKTLNP
jgi:Sap, sulfolipid-1-addressing protein